MMMVVGFIVGAPECPAYEKENFCLPRGVMKKEYVWSCHESQTEETTTDKFLSSPLFIDIYRERRQLFHPSSSSSLLLRLVDTLMGLRVH